MDKTTVRNLSAKIEDLLKKEGYSVRITGTYGSTNVSFKVAVSEISESGKVESREAKTLRMMASSMYNCPADVDPVGITFVTQRQTFKLTGYNTKAPKFPVQAVRTSDNQTFKFQESTLERIAKERGWMTTSTGGKWQAV